MDSLSFFLLPAFMLVVFLVLYFNGFLVLNSKRALTFVGVRQGREASFTACTGQIRRIVRFPESKCFQMTFTPQLTKGDVYVELLDHKQQILLLDSSTQTGHVSAEKGRAYTLVIHFRAASGKYTLFWG